MELLKWTDDYSVGIVIIDYQHKRLVMLINKLYDSMLEGKTMESITEIFEGLEDYIKNHFETEESFFKEFNYEDMKTHIKEHKVFVDQISQLKKDYLSGKNTVSVELLDFLKNWLSEHILGSDKKYISCFKENGVI
ncbi:MAG: hypothetical protein A3F72_14485 [Bacteroidetes bacterium RIFCSPLOWO2_12_FULL_35_15]|nr:MAG: hypothetical protein A3F72_14485 [Bacteroidetes bacterium RIFCSPLOWO2_12_FULL_35_15]